jgi:hypothetical protein
MMKKTCKYSAIVILTVVLAVGFTGSRSAWAGNGHTFVPGELLVQVKAGVSKGKIADLLSTHGADTVEEIKNLKIRRIKVPVHALERIKEALAKNPNICFVENNGIAQAGFEPNDDQYPSQWHLPKISAPEGWDMNTGAETVPIAIIDSGIDPTHPDLMDKLIEGYNFLENNTDTHDVRGHGTAVAGAAAAMTHNSIGVAGVAWDSPVMPLVVLNAEDWASYYDIARAITFAADNGVRIINISIGGSSSSSTLQNAVNYAWNKGAVVFACAQNYSTSTPYYPAACDNVVAVSATTSSDTWASFSNYGDWVDISAPGTSILTTNQGGGYGSWNGTSFSSPIVAGVAALMLSANPSLTNAQIVDLLTRTADDLGASGHDPYFGYGRVNAYQSLLAAVAFVPEPDTTDPSVVMMTPQDSAVVNGGITVTVSATDDGGVDRVELYVDGALLATNPTAPYDFYWDTTAYADGDYDLWAVAYDSAGNQGQSRFITISVTNEDAPGDTLAPGVAITSPGDGAEISNRVTIQASASDDTGISRMELFVDDVLKTAKTKSALSLNWNTRKVADGRHTILVKAFDTAGNEAIDTITVYK